MDTHDWRAQLHPHIRQINVNKIMTKLKIHQCYGDDDETLDVQKISKSFEQKTYAGALSQEDYLRKISSKMRLIDSCRRRAQLEPAIRQRMVIKITDSLKKHLPVSHEEGLVELHRNALRFEEKIYTAATSQEDYLQEISSMAQSISENYWRSLLQPDSRQRIINKILETLRRHVPDSGQEGLDKLRQIAARFEEKIYYAAISQHDYLLEISLKMVTMETGGQNTIANTMPSNFGYNGDGPSGTGRRSIRKRKQPQWLADFVTYR